MNTPSETRICGANPARPRGRCSSRMLGGLRHFARRSPLSAFWGCIALAIVAMAMAGTGSRALSDRVTVRLPAHAKVAR